MNIYVMRSGEQLGPFSPENAQAMIDNGDFSASDSASAGGLGEWKPLRDVLLSATGGVPKNKSLANQKPIGRIRRTLRALRGFVDRRLTARAVVVFTVLLMAAGWLYPPWIVGSGRGVSHGWFFVFDTTRDIVMRVDFGRLLLIDAIIAAAGGLLAWTFFQDSTGRRVFVRIVFYALVVAPLVAMICLGIVLIQNIQRDVAKRAVHTFRRFDPSSGSLSGGVTWIPPEVADQSKAWPPYDALIAYLAKKQPEQPVEVEIPGYGTAEFPAGMSSDEIVAVIKKQFFSGKSQNEFDQFDPDKYLAQKPAPKPKIDFEPDNEFVVAADDLKKITLFDVGPYIGKYPGIFVEPTNVGGFHGRIRNGLSRAIERVGIKASFFDAEGGLIEVRVFWMKDTTGVERLFPNTPVSFDSYVLVKHLPSGWRYRFEVTEAHYLQDISDKIAK